MPRRENQFKRYSLAIDTEERFEKVHSWLESQGSTVFLRDCLALSCALDMNFSDPAERSYTELGDLERKAKHSQDIGAISELSDRLSAFIEETPYYRRAKYIAAVPPRPGKTYDLPSTLAESVSKVLGLKDVTALFSRGASPGSIKNAAVEQKWDLWESTELELEGRFPPISCILLDDKYQSGITLQFVASRLLAAGFSRVYGLCVVKTLGDSDNG